MKHGLIKDRMQTRGARIVKRPSENYSTEGPEKVATGAVDAAILRREEMERRYSELRRAFLAFEKFMRDSMNFDLKSE